MDRKSLKLDDPSIIKSVELSDRENISAVLFGGEKSEDLEFIQERIDYLKLSPTVFYNGSYGKLYIKR
jgi:hypothetical protein